MSVWVVGLSRGIWRPSLSAEGVYFYLWAVYVCVCFFKRVAGLFLQMLSTDALLMRHIQLRMDNLFCPWRQSRRYASFYLIAFIFSSKLIIYDQEVSAELVLHLWIQKWKKKSYFFYKPGESYSRPGALTSLSPWTVWQTGKIQVWLRGLSKRKKTHKNFQRMAGQINTNDTWECNVVVVRYFTLCRLIGSKNVAYFISWWHFSLKPLT